MAVIGLFNIIPGIPSLQALVPECQVFQEPSRSFCEDVKTATAGSECPRGPKRYCEALAHIVQGNECDSLKAHAPTVFDQCQFIQRGYKALNLEYCLEEEEDHFKKENHQPKPNPSLCRLGSLVKLSFSDFNEKRDESALRNQFRTLLDKGCETARPRCFRGPLTSSALKLKDQVAAAVEPKPAECGLGEKEKTKVIDLCVKGFPAISKQSGFKITAAMTVKFFSNLVKGIEAHQGKIKEEKPKVYEKGTMIGDFVLPCAIQTWPSHDRFSVYLDKMQIQTRPGVEQEMTLAPLGTGNFKLVNFAMDYHDARPIIRGDLFGKPLHELKSTNEPLTPQQIHEIKIEFEIAKKFKGEPYLADIDDLHEGNDRITILQSYYPRGGDDLYDSLNLSNRQFVDGLPKDRFLTRFGMHLFEGLEEFHRQGFLHRDMKPDNIRVSRNEEGELIPKIIDFGEAVDMQHPHNVAVSSSPGTSPANSTPASMSGLTLGPRAENWDLRSWDIHLSPISKSPSEAELAGRPRVRAFSDEKDRPTSSPISGSGSNSGSGPRSQAISISAAHSISEYGGTPPYFSPEYKSSYANPDIKLDAALHNPKLDTWATMLSFYQISHGSLPPEYETNQCPEGVKDYQTLKTRCGIDCTAIIPNTLQSVICSGLNPDSAKRSDPKHAVEQFKTVLAQPAPNDLQYDLFHTH